MRLKAVLAAVAAISLLAFTARAGQRQEPYWDSKPLSYWMGLLAAQDAAIRIRAASSLAEMAIAHGGVSVAPAVPLLLPNLDDPLPDVRESTAHALEQIGAPAARSAVPTLLQLLHGDSRPEVRRRAALALGRIDPTAEDVVRAAARTLREDVDNAVRVSAAVLLMGSGRSASSVSPTLNEALADDDHAVRLYSAAALARAEGGQAPYSRLVEALADRDHAIRVEAVGLVADLGRGRPDLLPTLMRVLSDQEPEVRAAAADAIGAMGKAGRPALPTLSPLLRDPDETVRDRVYRAVRAIRSS